MNKCVHLGQIQYKIIVNSYKYMQFLNFICKKNFQYIFLEVLFKALYLRIKLYQSAYLYQYLGDLETLMSQIYPQIADIQSRLPYSGFMPILVILGKSKLIFDCIFRFYNMFFSVTNKAIEKFDILFFSQHQYNHAKYFF